jgi:hypothetical protein
MFRTHPPRLTYYTKPEVEGVELAGQKALLNSHYHLLWVLLWADSYKDLQVGDGQQGKQPDHMEVVVLGHTMDAAGNHHHVSYELLSAACIPLVGLVAGLVAVRYSTPHLRREEETEYICRHIPEHSSSLPRVVTLPHGLI